MLQSVKDLDRTRVTPLPFPSSDWGPVFPVRTKNNKTRDGTVQGDHTHLVVCAKRADHFLKLVHSGKRTSHQRLITNCLLSVGGKNREFKPVDKKNIKPEFQFRERFLLNAKRPLLRIKPCSHARSSSAFGFDAKNCLHWQQMTVFILKRLYLYQMSWMGRNPSSTPVLPLMWC